MGVLERGVTEEEVEQRDEGRRGRVEGRAEGDEMEGERERREGVSIG